MGYLTYAQSYKIIDDLVQMYYRIRTGMGVDTSSGACGIGTHLATLIEASADATFADRDIQIALNPAVSRLPTNLLGTNVAKAFMRQTFDVFAGVCAAAGAQTLSPTPTVSIVDIDSFLYYYNITTATKYQTLQAPEWRDLYYLMKGSYPRAANLYYSLLQDGTNVNGMGKFVVGGAFTDGNAINTSNYAGAKPYVKWTGGNGAGACTITVTGLDENGSSVSFTLSGTWGSGSFVATQTGVALTIPGGSNLITDVTNISTSGMSAGTLYVEGRQPAGRTYPLV